MSTVYGCILESKRLSFDDFEKIVVASDAWYRLDFCPSWDRQPGTVQTAVQCASYVVPCYIRDSRPGDPPGALAFHWIDPENGLPRIDVLADIILDQKDAAIDDIATALQHEIGEAAQDRDGNEWSDCGGGTEEPEEAVDRVQGGRYLRTIDRSDGTVFRMWCTDFLLPDAFNNTPPAGAKFDFMGLLKHPREVLPDDLGGGYKISRNTATKETMVFGNARAAIAYSHAALVRHGALEHARSACSSDL